MSGARISQRELRNDSATVLRRVEAGEELTITRRGEPVARLTSAAGEAAVRPAKPAVRRIIFSKFPRIRIDQTSEELLAAIRDDR